MTEHHGPRSAPCQASSQVRCANTVPLRIPADNGEYQRALTVIEFSTDLFGNLCHPTRNRRARARPSDTLALRWVDVIGRVDAGKPASTSCEELLYPVKEPTRFRSSNIGEATMNRLDGGGTRRRRTASAVSRRLQW
jgi:hypothetical protein